MSEVSIGDQFGCWTVIDVLPGNKRGGRVGQYVCRCQCGTVKPVWKSHLVRGDSKSCGCARPGGKDHYKWTGCGDLDGNHWNQIVRNANGKKGRAAIPIEITIEDAWQLFEKQSGSCALSDMPIQLTVPRTASLDRIDSTKGYVLGNIQRVHKDVNKMKNAFPQEHFVEICRKVANRNPK